MSKEKNALSKLSDFTFKKNVEIQSKYYAVVTCTTFKFVIFAKAR